MPVIQIDSPVDGSTVLADQLFAIAVRWDSGSKIIRRPGDPPALTVRCIDGTNVDSIPSNASSDEHSFSFPAGPNGTAMSVTAQLWENDAGGSPAQLLASDSVAVTAMALANLGGFIDLIGPPPPPPPPMAPIGVATAAAAADPDRFVCGPLNAGKANEIVCVTYECKDQGDPSQADRPPVGGLKPSQFTVWKKRKHSKGYAPKYNVAKSRWQVTVKKSLVDKNHIIQVWFIKDNKVVSTTTAALAKAAKISECL